MRIIEGETSERKSVNGREKNGQTINLSPLVSLNEEAVGGIEMMSRWIKVHFISANKRSWRFIPAHKIFHNFIFLENKTYCSSPLHNLRKLSLKGRKKEEKSYCIKLTWLQTASFVARLTVSCHYVSFIANRIKFLIWLEMKWPCRDNVRDCVKLPKNERQVLSHQTILR